MGIARPDRNLNPRVAGIGALLILALGFSAFAPYLDRYPAPYIDEGFYNLPAARVHDGLSFPAPASPSAPYGELIWAYHGPFYPHLQVLTFRMLGVTMFASRIPQYLGGFLAILLLSAIMLRNGCQWSALLLPVFWLGDRSLLESLYGRMDGLALLLLVATLGAFTEWLSAWNTRALFLCGLFAGLAVGIHPVTIVFAGGLGIVGLVLCPAGSRKSLLWYCLGGALAAAAILAFFAPHFPEAAKQFSWSAHLARGSNSWSHLWKMILVLRWSRYWAIALLAVTALFLLPAAGWLGFRYRSSADRFHALALSCSLFAILGCVLLVAVSAQLPYYLIYFSVWPPAALLVILETRVLPRALITGAVGAFVLLTAAWLPSAAWNALRAREARTLFPLLDPAGFVQTVRNVVPAGAAMQVSPDYLIEARPLGHEISRPWFSSAAELPAQDWLILSRIDIDQLGGPQVPGLRERTAAWTGRAFPETDAGGFMTIFTPARASAAESVR